MTEETNDMIPPENELPASLHKHLRTILPEKELNSFREQLPAEFLSDASEGLGHLKDTRQLESVLQHLNKQMHNQLAHKKTKKRRPSIGDQSWSFWAIIVIFLLIFIGYIVIRMLLRH